MTYLASIKYPTTTRSMMFKTISEAERWLDSMNNNCEYTTYIEEYDERWRKTDSFFYTTAKK